MPDLMNCYQEIGPGFGVHFLFIGPEIRVSLCIVAGAKTNEQKNYKHINRPCLFSLASLLIWSEN